MPLKISVAPTAEPISVSEAALHCRIDSDDENPLLAGYIQAAREYCEAFQNRAYINRTYELWLDEFPCDGQITLPMPPLVSVSSLDVYDTANTKTADAVLTDYFVDTKNEPGSLCLAYGKSWPATSLRPNNGICITFVAGYGATSASVPQMPKLSMLLLIGDYYAAREAGTASKNTIEAVERLLWLERIL